MDHLLKQFWAAWKNADRIATDNETYPGLKSHDAIRMAKDEVHRVARIIRLAELQSAKAPCPAPVPDIPGQQYLTDLLPPAGMIAPAKARAIA